MPELLYPSLAMLFGFIALVWGADKFVEGAAAIAKSVGMTPLIIGLTIVSLGTSAPEIMVSIAAALEDAGELAIGNAIGSNLANVGLVLGITALIANLPVHPVLLKQELPILVAVTAVAGLFLMDYQLVWWEGAVLLAMIVPTIGYLIIAKRKLAPGPGNMDEMAEDLPDYSPKMAVTWFFVGLLILLAGSKAMVYGAEEIALYFDVSPLIIGLTIVAVGTSLPELAASVMSALRGHHDIALGNIVGSNIFNLLAVMSIPGIINSKMLDPSVFSRDFVAMGGITLLLGIVMFMSDRMKGSGKASIGKLTGIVLLLIYFGYYVALYFQSAT